jgi:hypothetical protein
MHVHALSVLVAISMVACTEVPKSGHVPDETGTTTATTGDLTFEPGGNSGGTNGGTTDPGPTDPGTEPVETTWYFDGDGDGYGLTATAVLAVTAPSTDWVQLGGDCQDANPAIYPNALEIPLNGVDDDCDPGTIDGSAGPVDADGDLFNTISDCDDTNPNINPGETEIPGNGVDDDCNAATSDAPAVLYWHYLDADGDGYGALLGGIQDPSPVPLPGRVLNDDDCDDANPNKNPGELEAVDGIDNDCDGLIDEGGNGAAVTKTIVVTPLSQHVSVAESWQFFVLNDTTGDHDYWFDYIGFGGIGPFLTGVGTTTESADYEAMPGDLIKFNGWDSTTLNYLVGGCNTCVGAELCDLSVQKCSYAEVDCGNGQIPTFSPNSYDLICYW